MGTADLISLFEASVTMVMAAVNVLGAIVILHIERRNPRAAVLWLLIMFVLSTFGLVIYLLFGLSAHRIRRRYRAKEAEDRMGLEALRQRADLDGTGPNLGADLASRSSLVRMLLANQSRLSSGNRVDLITDGNKKFRLLFKDLEEARDHIHAEYYVLRDDELGNRFLDLLVRDRKSVV